MFHAAAKLRRAPTYTRAQRLVAQPWMVVLMQNLARQLSCSWCGEARRRLRRCGGCLRVCFCSRKCQKRAWNLGGHKCRAAA